MKIKQPKAVKSAQMKMVTYIALGKSDSNCESILIVN